ncbi:amidohydrolase [Pseudobacillus wudalianchiensis]|uniref:Amidohydrolase n=1 Tax=Pseudobacillus wudalianchiensis TaxID=1743143 RepID=A0A1B9B6Y8_9BACI|nr:amidohydrolase [Bacillus wudalianchiensis]OCA91865.1 amidohydrolase [Bacillus wudalianchiensis]
MAKADIILKGNAIFTGLTDEPVSGAVIIQNNRISDICTEEKSKTYIGTQTKVYSFNDELILPGFHDFHLHLFLGSLYADSVSLIDAKSEQEAAAMVKEFADQRPDDPWIFGFRWYHVHWDQHTLPSRQTLDELIPDRPVLLVNEEGHGIWLNTKAMEVLGIDKQTPEPAFGKIFKDESGEPIGILYETAISLAQEAFRLPKEKEEQLLEQFLNKAAKFGITSVSDMLPLTGYELGDIHLYKQFEEEGKLTTRINFLTVLNGNLDYAKRVRRAFNSKKLKFSGLKQFLDGVPATYTALMLEDYTDLPTAGEPFLPPETIKKWVAEADREGFRVRLHACGDGAVQLGLDAYEEAMEANGRRDARHTIEHIEVIDPDDIPRFSRLGVIASMQPEHMNTEEFASNVYLSRLGKERSRRTWSIKSLQDSQAHLAFGSDYPIVEINPLLGIYRAVTRENINDEPKGGWNPNEKIKLADALRFYTLGSAYGVFAEDELGTLEKGKLADLTVLDRNLFALPAKDILQAKVKLTIMDGMVVYEHAQSEKLAVK